MKNELKEMDSLKGLEFLELAKEKFESSSGLTEQFAHFSKVFAKGFRTYLQREYKATEIDINRNHFEMYGFFKVGDTLWYYSVGDLRWDKTFLIRTAKNHEDFTGGTNNYVSMKSSEIFDEQMRKMIL